MRSCGFAGWAEPGLPRTSCPRHRPGCRAPRNDSSGAASAKPHRSDAGNGGEFVQNLVLHPHHALGILCNRFRDHRMQYLDLFGVRESRLHAAQLLKRANHQAGADEQHERERHLHHDQRVARPVALPAVAERSADTPQRGRDTGSCVFQDRDDAEEHAREQRHTEGERQHERIDADFAQPRQGVRTFRDQDPQRRIRQAETQRAAQHSQRHAFDEHFPRDSSPAGAQRGPDRELLLAGLGAYEQQIGHVRAGDQAAPAPASPSPPTAPCRCLRRFPASAAGAWAPRRAF